MSQIVIQAGGLIYSFHQVGQQVHDFTGLPLTSDGFTDFTAMYQHEDRYLDSRIVFVSSSDGNDGTAVTYTPASPEVGSDPFAVTGGVMAYATFTAAINRMRNGFPDIMLLKRGDTWSGDFTWLNWQQSGRSTTEKMIIAAYGVGDRPVITNGRFHSFSNTVEPPTRHLAMVGLEFYGSFNDPDSSDYGMGTTRLQAISILQQTADDILIEDNKVSFYDTGLYMTGGPEKNTNVVIRRNVFVDAVAFGILAPRGDGMLIEENVMHRNGWAVRTNKLHSIYCMQHFNLTIRNNILARSGLFGVKTSSDYIDGARNILMENNLFFKSTLGLAGFSAGAQDYDPTVDYGTTNADILNNVFLNPGKILPFDGGPTSTYTGAGTTENINDLLMDGNIYTHNVEFQGVGIIMQVGGWSSKSSGIVIRNAIVHNWFSSYFNGNNSYIRFTGDVVDVTLENNWPTGVSYADPDRDLTTYSQSIGGAADPEAFLTRASQQSRANWDARYTAAAFNEYIRAGFTVT